MHYSSASCRLSPANPHRLSSSEIPNTFCGAEHGRGVSCKAVNVDQAQTVEPTTTLRNGRHRTPTPPFNVVVTGASKGLGFELAREFLRAGDDVLISSRNSENVTQAMTALRSEFGEDVGLSGVKCDVTSASEVAELADYAKDAFGNIHFWINNAGTNAYQYGSILEFSADDLRQILETNLLGVFLSTKEAIRVMRGQEDEGHIFAIEGAGSSGRPTPRIAAYGATKRAILQFTDTINEELKIEEISNIGAHILSPGMCVTDLLMSGDLTEQAKFFINCLAEHPSVPARQLIPEVRRLPAKGNKKVVRGRRVEYLTQTKAYSQIFKRLVFSERKNRHVEEE